MLVSEDGQTKARCNLILMNRISNQLNEYELKSIDRFVEIVQQANFDVITEQMSMGDATALILNESRVLANGLEFGFPNDPFDKD